MVEDLEWIFLLYSVPLSQMKNWLIETDRLGMRAFVPNDAPLIFELNSDPKVIQYTGDPAFQSFQEAREFLINYKDYEKNNMGRWAVFIKSTNEFIGFCGLKKHDDGMVDLGYRFMQKHWGKGYATESSMGCIEYAKNHLDLTEIIGRTSAKNTGSMNVLEKLGFQFSHRDECNGLENAMIFRLDLRRP